MAATRLLVLCVGWATAASAQPSAAPIPDDKCMECHSDKDLTRTLPDGREVSIFVDQAQLRASSHATNTCFNCHGDLTEEHPDNEIRAKPVDCATCHERQSHDFGISVHGLALEAGSETAPNCKDCHGYHDVLPPTHPESPLHFSRQAATCGQCHPAEAEEVAASIHGQAAARGVREAPTCTDCHTEHSIEALGAANGLGVARDACSKCHASERLNTKFGLPTDRVSTFMDSYHGLAVQAGLASAANCASCHDHHLVLPSTDPASPVHPSQLVETCGQCHPGATERFAQGRVHTAYDVAEEFGAKVNQWARRIYLILIFAVVGGLSLHNLLSLMRSAMMARHTRGPTIMRMDVHQRIQHFLLLSSFTLLALSGFALKYPDTWLAWMFGADENIRRWVHRVAGVILLGLGVWHLVYIAVTHNGRQLVKDLWFRTQDLKDIVTNLRYFAGHSTLRAKFRRFGYVEKLEYWAVVWGTIIMGVTGLMIWLKIDVTQWFPRWVVDVALTIHYYEAILACLAIVVWHFYHVIFAPGTYPMNWAWWDGRVSEEWHQEEHPLEHVDEAPPKKKDVDRATADGI
jgi:cytochrome b subunit of formate dehydrogenase